MYTASVTGRTRQNTGYADRMSLAIFINDTATVFREPEASTIAS
jgi:hypothetical protein